MSAQPHVLVIDDDRRLRDLTAQFLQECHFYVSKASNADEARSRCSIQKFDAIIADIMMPGETGVEFIKSIRSTIKVPVIMLTARDKLEDKIQAFDVGADDYLTKPFEPLELSARLKALLRRSLRINKQFEVIVLGNNKFNTETNILQDPEGISIPLTSTELGLLKTLSQKPNHPFSRESLAQKIGYKISERAIDVQITRLRRKMGDNSKFPRYIKTIRHIGYVLSPTDIITNVE